MTKDYLVRALAFNDEVRAFAVQTTNTIQKSEAKRS